MNKLAEKKEEYLVISEGSRNEIVIGAPHHAPAGVKRLPCSPPRASDQNTGFLALCIANLLKCSAIISVNARNDPNKKLNTKYSKALIQLAPNYLIEIHGHGGGKSKFDIEISAGSMTRNKWSKTFDNFLQDEIVDYPELQDLIICGDFSNIYYKATQTVTMQQDDWIGIHVELPLLLRKKKNSIELPAKGQQFSKCVATTIEKTIAHLT